MTFYRHHMKLQNFNTNEKDGICSIEYIFLISSLGSKSFIMNAYYVWVNVVQNEDQAKLHIQNKSRAEDKEQRQKTTERGCTKIL